MSHDFKHMRSLIWAIHWMNATDYFEHPFTSLGGWRSYLRAKPLDTLSHKAAQQWGPPDFHRLFISCWIHRPVEKGSFMIPLTNPTFAATVKKAMGSLNFRWSSHLSESGARSAANGWSFLKGYHELLVQFEEENRVVPHLFLKAEGHTAFEWSHIKAFINKVKTGQGLMANEALHRAGQSASQWVVGRAAENFDKPYKKLLKEVGLEKPTTTVHEAIPRIADRLKREVRVLHNSRTWTDMALQSVPHKRSMARVIREVIVPTAKDPNTAQSSLVSRIRAAEEELLALAETLEVDADSPDLAFLPRVYQEVRVPLSDLRNSENKFLEGLDLAWMNAQQGKDLLGRWPEPTPPA